MLPDNYIPKPTKKAGPDTSPARRNVIPAPRNRQTVTMNELRRRDSLDYMNGTNISQIMDRMKQVPAARKAPKTMLAYKEWPRYAPLAPLQGMPLSEAMTNPLAQYLTSSYRPVITSGQGPARIPDTYRPSGLTPGVIPAPMNIKPGNAPLMEVNNNNYRPSGLNTVPEQQPTVWSVPDTIAELYNQMYTAPGSSAWDKNAPAGGYPGEGGGDYAAARSREQQWRRTRFQQYILNELAKKLFETTPDLGGDQGIATDWWGNGGGGGGYGGGGGTPAFNAWMSRLLSWNVNR
jgi:hypothetical protein